MAKNRIEPNQHGNTSFDQLQQSANIFSTFPSLIKNRYNIFEFLADYRLNKNDIKANLAHTRNEKHL